MRPGDPLFITLGTRLADVGDGSPVKRLRAAALVGRLSLRLLKVVWRAPVIRVTLSDTARAVAFWEFVTWRAGPWTLPQPLLSVLSLRPEWTPDHDGDVAAVEQARRNGVTVALLRDPATARALYATCLGISPETVQREDPVANRLLQFPELVAVAALDQRQAVICVALAVFDGDQAFLGRLVLSRTRDCDDIAMTAVHVGLTDVLAAAGPRYLWTHGPLRMDVPRQMLLRRFGYQCTRLRLAGEAS